LNLALPLGALYLLAAPSTPEEVVEKVIARAEAGEKITRNTVKAEVRTRTIEFHEPELRTTPVEVRGFVEASPRYAPYGVNVEEAISAILKFGRVAEGAFDVADMHARLHEKQCGDEFFAALEQAASLLRSLKPKQ
jgi:hypothetical protein